jgi:hypothetical protein
MAVKGIAEKHGHYIGGKESRIHATWRAMVLRCHDPKNASFKRYGARGIHVCAEWRENFEAFLADMGLPPSPGHSLDREDNDGPYSPQNCRWATRQEQGRNRGTCRMIVFRGEVVPLVVAAEALGISHACLSGRLRMGWDPETAFSRPKQPRKSSGRLQVEIDGQPVPLAEAAKRANVSLATYRKRIKAGWSPERAMAPSLR